MSSDPVGSPAGPPTRGRLFIVSAPSGAGKTTVVEELVRRVPGLARSRSYTSRAPRPAEQDGVDYHFVNHDAFQAMVARGEFLEWADVFGDLKGTRAADTEELLAAGRDVVLVIDVQGARQVRERGLPATSVFVLPPSFAVLERRLRGRSQDSESAIRRRLATAREEVAAWVEYDYVVVNDALDTCVERLRHIVLAARARRDAMAPVAERVWATFAADDPGGRQRR